jgi:RNA polymerase sigma-70 factor (ECF subfamily)
LQEYFRDPKVPFIVWLRMLTSNKLRELHRHHLGTQMRDASRDVALHDATYLEATSAAMAAHLLADVPRPSEAAIRAEVKRHLQQALDSMDPIDREVLALRHIEQLTPTETAHVLDIKEKAAGMRYVRALRRLKEILAQYPEVFLEP